MSQRPGGGMDSKSSRAASTVPLETTRSHTHCRPGHARSHRQLRTRLSAPLATGNRPRRGPATPVSTSRIWACESAAPGCPSRGRDGLQAGAPIAISPGTRPCARCEAPRAGPSVCARVESCGTERRTGRAPSPCRCGRRSRSRARTQSSRPITQAVLEIRADLVRSLLEPAR
jgi:hypothetical protein